MQWSSKGHFYVYLTGYSIFWASLCLKCLLSIVSELNGQPDEVDVGDSPVPGCGERLDQLAFDYRMSLDYLQGYSNLFCTRDSQSDSYPVIGWARSASWFVLALPVGDQFGTMTGLTVIL